MVKEATYRENNLMITADSKVVLLTPSYEGRIHDKRIADRVGYSPPRGSILYQDSGFQGFTFPDVKIIQPEKKPKGRHLRVEEKAKNREISSIRIRVEHAISSYQKIPDRQGQVAELQKRIYRFSHETCCGLHNFRLNFRPWSYRTHLD